MNTRDRNAGQHPVMYRAALAVVTLIGAFLIVFPLAIGLPGKTSSTATLMNAMRPQMSDAALAQGRADGQTMQAMGTQLTTQMLPALAQQMHMTPQQLQAYLGANFPTVAKGLTEFGTILPYFGGLQTTMAQQQSNFQQADQIPTGYMSPTTMTWLFVIPGVALVLIGIFGLLRPERSRRLVAAGGAVGLILGIGLLGTSMYGKASAADDMTVAFKPVFAAQNVQQMRAYTDTVTTMATDLSQKVMPAVATALQATPTQLNQLIAQTYPDVARGMVQMPAILQRMQTVTGLMEANVANFNDTAAIPWSPGSMVTVYWFMMVPALVLVVGAAAVLLAGERLHLVPARGAPHRPMHA